MWADVYNTADGDHDDCDRLILLPTIFSERRWAIMFRGHQNPIWDEKKIPKMCFN